MTQNYLTADTSANAASFPYHFSTKPQDPTTGLYYYGYRWYDPLTGRWPSRDPIEEEGGVNLYGFVGNDGVDRFDIFGLVIGTDQDDEYKKLVISALELLTDAKLVWKEYKFKKDCTHFDNEKAFILHVESDGNGEYWDELKKIIDAPETGQGVKTLIISRVTSKGVELLNDATCTGDGDLRRLSLSEKATIRPYVEDGTESNGYPHYKQEDKEPFEVALGHELICHGGLDLKHDKCEANTESDRKKAWEKLKKRLDNARKQRHPNETMIKKYEDEMEAILNAIPDQTVEIECGIRRLVAQKKFVFIAPRRPTYWNDEKHKKAN